MKEPVVNYSFDDFEHIHRINKMVVPGLTATCESNGFSDYSKLPEDIRAAALTFGRDVHLATDLYDRDQLDPESVDARVGGCLEAYRKFHMEHRVDWEYSEEPCGHAAKGSWFGCVIDRAGRLDGRKAIVEIKTGEFAEWHRIQVASQREAMRFHHGFVCGRVYGLYLSWRGTYRLLDLSADLEAHFSAFQSALNIHQWRKNYLRLGDSFDAEVE